MTVEDFLKKTIFYRIDDLDQNYPFSVDLANTNDPRANELNSLIPTKNFDLNLVKNINVSELTNDQKFEIGRVIFASHNPKFNDEILAHFNSFLKV